MGDQHPILLDYAPGRLQAMRKSTKVLIVVGAGAAIMVGGCVYEAFVARSMVTMGMPASPRAQWQQQAPPGQVDVRGGSHDASSISGPVEGES